MSEESSRKLVREVEPPNKLKRKCLFSHSQIILICHIPHLKGMINNPEDLEFLRAQLGDWRASISMAQVDRKLLTKLQCKKNRQDALKSQTEREAMRKKCCITEDKVESTVSNDDVNISEDSKASNETIAPTVKHPRP